MQKGRIEELRTIYRKALLDDVIPFWLTHSLDRQYGGYLTCLDRQGAAYNTDKSIILQGREIWVFSRLYNTLSPRKEWLDAARTGYEFVSTFGFDTDRRMFFSVTRDGRPLRKRRYFYAEAFATIGFSEYAKASGNSTALELSRDLYRRTVLLYHHPELLPAKVFPETRQTKALLNQLILLTVCQELRYSDTAGQYSGVLDEVVEQLLRDFVDPRGPVLLETVGAKGEHLDSPEGRCVNPGHAVECSWHLLHEAIYRNDHRLEGAALEILEGSLQLGWDNEQGGLFAFVDIEGRPPEQLEWDMKLWWPHNEALYATLLAYQLTGRTTYLDWFERIHEWTFSHFPDPQFGGWFGYLHRDGTVALPVKGSLWKGVLHEPRCLVQCLAVLDRMAGEGTERDSNRTKPTSYS
jgi:N-acylglucosamine 2-epimerase